MTCCLYNHLANSENMILNVFGLVNDSIVDGPGLRFVVFVQGCTHKCPGCHNPESQAKDAGKIYTVDEIEEKIRANKIVKAVTFSGGEPFEQAQACAELAGRLKADGYNVWTYTGYLFEDLLANSQTDASIAKLLKCTDVLVDGPFVEALHSYDAKWRGSTNQRVIDVAKSIECRSVVELEENK